MICHAIALNEMRLLLSIKKLPLVLGPSFIHVRHNLSGEEYRTKLNCNFKYHD